MPNTDRAGARGGSVAGCGSIADRAMPAPLMGNVALGLGCLFVQPAHVDHHADHRVAQYIGPIANEFDHHIRHAQFHQHHDLAWRFRLHGQLGLAFER